MKKKVSILFVLMLLVTTLTACGSRFSIEGKWKSVGKSGFGQAQPGAIVVFDGEKCNFFSPSDTYALYEKNGTYTMDVTAFMSTDTLTFQIDVIDDDQIILTYGSSKTELQRVK